MTEFSETLTSYFEPTDFCDSTFIQGFETNKSALVNNLIFELGTRHWKIISFEKKIRKMFTPRFNFVPPKHDGSKYFLRN